MSFILDALKKAESERNRQTGPVLMDVRIAPPRRRLPAWAVVIGLVLVANLGILAWLLLHKQTPVPETATVPPTVEVPATPAPAPAPAVMAPAVAPAVQPLPATSVGAALSAPADPEAEILPTADELRAAGIALPSLQLNLHAFDTVPAARYVLLNSVRLREGEFTSEGVKVERITPVGVVLEASGRRFLLRAGG